MDLVVGLDATTGFMQQDTDGTYRFRVVDRFALRLKATLGGRPKKLKNNG
jgi:hypothetical protein